MAAVGLSASHAGRRSWKGAGHRIMKNEVMAFDYLYEEQSEQFAFYRIPKILMTDTYFDGLSTDAKVLYGLCLDRVALSRRNGWSDKEGRVFIYYTLDAIEEDIGCAVQKAVKLLKELETYGLIERRKRGQGKPSEIYVKNFLPRIRKSQVKTCENHSSGLVNITGQDFRNSKRNNTDINNTDLNKTDLILSGGCDVDVRKQYRDYFRERIDMNTLMKRYPHREEALAGIEDIILDTVCTDSKQIRVMGQNMSTDVVRSRFMKLDSDHIAYVMDRLHATTTKIRNIRQYLVAALYNAPSTIDAFYQQEVQHDLAHTQEE